MIYVVFFSNAGVPATGLTPTIGVYKKVSDGNGRDPGAHGLGDRGRVLQVHGHSG